MERYSEYKDSGIQRIGEIPSHWERTKVSRLFKQIGSGTTPSSGDASLYADEGTPWLQSGDFNNNEINSTSRFITDKALDNYSLKLYKPGGVVIAMYGASIGKVGMLNIATTVNQACCVLSDSDHLLQKYAFYVFVNEKENLVKKSKGGTQPNISQEIIKSHYIPLPPLSEQERIVKFLEGKVLKIDEYIADKEREIQLLKELKEAEISKAVTQGLNPNVKMKDSGIPWIGMIPEHWEMNILKRYINKRKTGCWGSEPKALEIDCFCLRIADFEYDNYRFQSKDNFTIRSYKEKDLEERILKQGDILIEKSGGGEKSPVGRAVLYDLPIENAMYANFMEKISPKDELSSNYLLYLLATMYSKRAIWRYIKFTTGIQNLDITALLSNEKIPIPPIDEQRSIVAYIEQKCSKINSLISELEAEIEHLKEYKQRMIADCVTGQINVQNL